MKPLNFLKTFYNFSTQNKAKLTSSTNIFNPFTTETHTSIITSLNSSPMHKVQKLKLKEIELLPHNLMRISSQQATLHFTLYSEIYNTKCIKHFWGNSCINLVIDIFFIYIINSLTSSLSECIKKFFPSLKIFSCKIKSQHFIRKRWLWAKCVHSWGWKMNVEYTRQKKILCCKNIK